MTKVMLREERLWNICVLQTVHLSNRVILQYNGLRFKWLLRISKLDYDFIFIIIYSSRSVADKLRTEHLESTSGTIDVSNSYNQYFVYRLPVRNSRFHSLSVSFWLRRRDKYVCQKYYIFY
jgi:hypothetical protein